jgi:beta-lactamase class D
MRFVFAVCAALGCAVPAFAEETCTIVADVRTGKPVVRDGICGRRVAPQSSFKLPLALMGYDSGILVDERTPRWDYKSAFGGFRDEEKTTHDPTSWEKISVVWFSQELTRKLGEKRFAKYVADFGYGNQDVAGDPGRNNGLTHAWLMSSLQISPDEQVAFVVKMLNRTLPVSAHAYDMTARIMPEFEAGGWKVRGKTGSGFMRDKNGKIDRSRPLGWFVGWAEKDGRTLAFARLFLGDRPSKQYGGMIARDAFLTGLPALAGSTSQKP